MRLYLLTLCWAFTLSLWVMKVNVLDAYFHDISPASRQYLLFVHHWCVRVLDSGTYVWTCLSFLYILLSNTDFAYLFHSMNLYFYCYMDSWVFLASIPADLALHTQFLLLEAARVGWLVNILLILRWFLAPSLVMPSLLQLGWELWNVLCAASHLIHLMCKRFQLFWGAVNWRVHCL